MVYIIIVGKFEIETVFIIIIATFLNEFSENIQYKNRTNCDLKNYLTSVQVNLTPEMYQNAYKCMKVTGRRKS